MAKWQPGQSGNPNGKPKGARNKTTLAVLELLEGEAQAITRKIIDKAKKGDITALRICMDRLAPPPKDRPVDIDLPPMVVAADAVKASAAILAAVGEGQLTPSEAAYLSRMIEGFTKSIEVYELERRLSKLETMKGVGLRQ